MASVGFCVVSTTKRGYPLEDATHIAFSKTHTQAHTVVIKKDMFISKSLMYKRLYLILTHTVILYVWLALKLFGEIL